MKDKHRIQKITNLLYQLWIDKYPECRFFQFISFIESETKKRFDTEDLFYLKDDGFERFLYELQVNIVDKKK
jgi:hypothetical protein